MIAGLGQAANLQWHGWKYHRLHYIFLYNAILFQSIFMERNVLNTSFTVVQIPFPAQLPQHLFEFFGSVFVSVCSLLMFFFN